MTDGVGRPAVLCSDFANSLKKLRISTGCGQLLQLGAGLMLDQWGIDWWDVLSLEIAPQLQQLMLVRRLSKELDASCELYSSRPHPLATALQRLLGSRLTILETRAQSVIRRIRHYHNIFSQLDTVQLAQVMEDKFDINHSIRRHFTRRGHTSGQPVILLPSAYTNVSRAALSYAELLPDHQFLLVCARSNAKLTSLPANVGSTSLAPYFVPSDKRETVSLLESWKLLRKQLVAGAEEFSTADAVGVLGRIPALLPWGIALRDAWSQVFESENVTACLCADDSNPPSSIPLILAKKRGLPALACHHGALNYMMAIKQHFADFYLVKSEMEQDYVQHICRSCSREDSHGGPGLVETVAFATRRFAALLRGWFFSPSPIRAGEWRKDEVYRDLLPRLCSLAQTCGLRLVFKLHPFESVKGHRRMLRRLASGARAPDRSDCRPTVGSVLEQHTIGFDRAIFHGFGVCCLGHSRLSVRVAARFLFRICSAVRAIWCRSRVGIPGTDRRDSSAAWSQCGKVSSATAATENHQTPPNWRICSRALTYRLRATHATGKRAVNRG